jgi:hypothetical protein
VDKSGAEPNVAAIGRFRPHRWSVPSNYCPNKKLMDPDMTYMYCTISESKLDKEYHEIMVMLVNSRHSYKISKSTEYILLMQFAGQRTNVN